MDKLRHVSIAVSDIEAAARFYETTFGLERVKQTEKNIEKFFRETVNGHYRCNSPGCNPCTEYHLRHHLATNPA